MAITSYSGSTPLTMLANSLLAAKSGISINDTSVALNASSLDAVNFYDGSLNLGIGAGLLLTSGYAPGTINNSTGDGQDNSNVKGFDNGDADINAVVNTVFQTQSYDATTLAFDFTATDPTATSISFDIVFGSEEYPEWVDAFVDSAVVIVNGVNYALFNHDPNAPLSVISSNLAAGYFQDNADNHLQIQYDGVSNVLKIVAPINGNNAVNHIKIGIADTGDHILDSGIFISNLTAGNIPGSGVVSQTTGGSGNDTLMGSSQAEYFDLQGGNDIVYAGAGDDIVVAGSGNDMVYGGTGADKMEGDEGDDYLDGGADSDTAVFKGNFSEYKLGSVGSNTTLTSTAEGTDTLVNIEFVQFKDGLYEITSGLLTAVGTPTPVANTAGIVAISGIAMAGKTLTAIVTDADGLPAANAIGYAWQTSDDGGTTWIDSGVTTKTYVLSAADIGKQIQVIASFADATGNPELPVSSVVTVAQQTAGFTIDPMIISAPAGASVMDPLTTLIKNAVDFGYTPNEAALAVKSVFGIDSSINLATYDAYAVLSKNPTDLTAVEFMKVAAQVAMTASVSDPSGMNMMLAVMNAAADGTTLDLTNASDLATVGVDSTVDPLTGKSPLDLIQNLNKNMAEDPTDLAGIETAWNDWAGKTDKVEAEFLNHLEKISVHINQAPTGTATADLPLGQVDTGYIVSASDLLVGFSDLEGDTLSVADLNADNGSVTDNNDGTYTITFATGYTGPVELTYAVTDGKGGSAPASQMFVVQPDPTVQTNSAPALTGAPAILFAGSEDTSYTVSAADLLAGYSDADGDTLSVAGLLADHGDVTDNGDGTFTITPTANFNGVVTLTYDVTDGTASIAATQNFTLAAVNDGPTGSATASLIAGVEDVAYSVKESDLLIGFSDIEGDVLTVSGLVASNGTVTTNSDGTFTITPVANFNGTVSLTYAVIDGNGGSVAAVQSYSLAAVNDSATGSVTISGVAAQGQTLTASNSLQDVDGLGTIGYQWLAGGVAISGATKSTFTLTQAEVGKSISVIASFTDQGGTLESVASPATATVQASGVTLTGTASADVLNGGAGDDTLNGLAGNDTLNGNAGNDILNGGAGSDKMAGGTGNDTYYVDSTGDTITEATGSGTDTVISSLSAFTLGANLENLTLSGTASINGTGNTLTNILLGNSASNILSGLAGNDILNGAAGNDKLIGGTGNDNLMGGTGADIFRFESALNATSNLDTVVDFVVIDDTFQLENAVFTKLTKTGALSALSFVANATGTAGDANDFIVYNTATGALSYDADGNGAGVAIQFATLVGLPAITAADFVVT